METITETILHSLNLARLRFDLTILHPAEVPPYKGDILRMALLWHLSDVLCPMDTRCRDGCRRPDTCMFGLLNEPPPDPKWPHKLRNLVGDKTPAAYVPWDLNDRRTHLRAGDPWAFEIALIGDLALSQLPAIVEAMHRGAENGIGRMKLRARLRRVSAITPDRTQTLVDETPDGLAWQTYDPGAVAFGYLPPAREPVHSLGLRYLSPVKLKLRGEWVETPDFNPVMRAVVRRLRIVSAVHGGGEWPHEAWGPLLDLAETVRLDYDETHRTGYGRYSKRGGKHELGGFVGQAWYTSEEDLEPLMPALWLAQWLHIGKAHVFGNGRYMIEQVW